MSNTLRFPDAFRLPVRQLASRLQQLASSQERSEPLRVLFTGSENGVGTSTLVEAVACMLVRARIGSVLLVGGVPRREQAELETDPDSEAYEPTRLAGLPPFGAADELGRVLEQVGEGHRFLLLDSDPITEAIETQLLADRCDAAWLVVATGRSRWSNARSAATLLRSTKAGSKGVILNRKGRGLPRWLQRVTDRPVS